MARKHYRIDFYQITIQPTAEVASPEAGLQSLLQLQGTISHNDNEYTRELFGLTSRRGGSSIGGRLRKFRTSDLPEIGSLGENAEAIVLAQGQGLIEQNFFVWYREHNVIAWHVNGHASPIARFAAFLSEVWGTRVDTEPVIQAGAMQRLMTGNAEVKRLILTLPRPTNPALFQNDNFASNTLQLLSQSGADGMHIEMGVNLKLNPRGGLAGGVKQFMRNMTSLGATTAKVIVEQDGIIHPIDLVADRVSTTITSDANARFPFPDTMYQLIDGARDECQEAINEYFGPVGGTLN